MLGVDDTTRPVQKVSQRAHAAKTFRAPSSPQSFFIPNGELVRQLNSYYCKEYQYEGLFQAVNHVQANKIFSSAWSGNILPA